MYLRRVGHETCAAEKATVRCIYVCDAVHYVVRGQGFFNGKKLGAGMGFICRNGELAEYRPDPTDPWEYYWIRMEEDPEREFLRSVPCGEDGIFVHSLSEKLEAFYRLFCEMDGAEGELLRRTAFPKIACAFHQANPEGRETSGERYTRQVKQIIEDRLSETVRIGEIAEQMHLNRCYLRSLFWEQEGISPCQYRQKRRMEYAGELLRQSDHAVGAIANSVGYSNPLQFTREFKKYFSVSPVEYRKSFRKSVDK